MHTAEINVNVNSVDIAGTSPDGETLSIYTLKKKSK